MPLNNINWKKSQVIFNPYGQFRSVVRGIVTKQNMKKAKEIKVGGGLVILSSLIKGKPFEIVSIHFHCSNSYHCPAIAKLINHYYRFDGAKNH